MTEIITVTARYAVRHFRELLEQALRGRVVRVTHYGRPRVWLISDDHPVIRRLEQEQADGRADT